MTQHAPETLSVWLRILNLPDLPFVPEPVRGRLATAVYFTHIGDAQWSEHLVAPLRRLGRPLVENVGPMSISQLGTIADEPEDPAPAAVRAVLLDDLGTQVRDIASAAVTEPGAPINLLAIRHLGGALARPALDDGAAGTVDEPYLLLAVGIGPSVDLVDPIQDRIDRLVGDLSGHHGGRVPFNFSERSDLSDSMPAATVERLRAIKRQRDPAGVIRGNRPVLNTTPTTPDDLAGI